MRYMTAGEANGSDFAVIVADAPAGLRLSAAAIDADVDRWAHGCSCGQRAASAYASIVSGIEADGRTTGAPVAIALSSEDAALPADEDYSIARNGSPDLLSMLVYDADDCAGGERSFSPRACAATIAAAGVAREFLATLGVDVLSYVTRIGDVAMREDAADFEGLRYEPLAIETSAVRCPSSQASRSMADAVEAARAAGDVLGGEVALVISGVVPGLGDMLSTTSLAASLSAAVFAVPGVVGVSFGAAQARSVAVGSKAADAIAVGASGFTRETNLAGGLEAGVSTGMPIVMRIAFAPVPVPAVAYGVQTQGLYAARRDAVAYEPCIVAGLGVAAEAHVAFALANAYQQRFGGKSMQDVRAALSAYEQRLKVAAR